MASSLKRIEKEFILSAVRDEKSPLLLLAGSGEWPCTIVSVDSDSLELSHAMPLRLLRRSEVYEFRFIYREQSMAFRARIRELKESKLIIEMPETVYKNLGRRYSRRPLPSDLVVSFSFKGDRYELAFPTSQEFESVSEPERNSNFDPHDIRVLISDFNARAESFASERAIRMFKERTPESMEERVMVRTGKIFYLPSSAGGLPVVDPFMSSRIVTKDIFADCLRDEGMREDLVEDEVLRYERNKKNLGPLSELLIPLLFQEYIIGYVYLANTQEGKPPFDLNVLEIFHQFAKVLAYSLKINGYFRSAPKRKQDFPADVIDISAGGLLFSCSSRELLSSLASGSGLDVSVTTKGRTIVLEGMVKRVYRDLTRGYFGVEFSKIEPEDFRFLFESLYGRAFTDEDARGIEGLGSIG